MRPNTLNELDNNTLTEEEVMFLEAIQNESMRNEIISILTRSE